MTGATAHANDELPGRDLSHLISWRTRLLRYLAAALSGLLLSSAFPPLEWSFTAWFALVPLLLVLTPPMPSGRAWRLGWLFGFAHFATCLHWLNEVGFAAGYLLALVCAFFPMFWCRFVLALFRCTGLRWNVSTVSGMSAAGASGAGIMAGRSTGVKRILLIVWPVLILPASWVTSEWVRSWLFTGFPWNLLGVSQWQQAWLTPLVRITGVHGLTFLVVAVNAGVAITLRLWWQSGEEERALPRLQALAPGALALLFFLPALAAVLFRPSLPPPDDTLRAAVVQGNIPQMRVYTPDQLRLSLDVYTRLSEEIAAQEAPDLIVWPETAIPAPVRFSREYVKELGDLFAIMNTPLLVGSIDYRPVPSAEGGGTEAARESTASFNSAMLFSAMGKLRDFYDKIHLVPFGEYVPFERLWPWLNDAIGMGRSLTPGAEYTLFRLPHGARAGVNICYEDVYPHISRRFALAGANLLITLTNDAWYAQSAGSRQHMVHAVFRAVETGRPLLRSGNNSDSCLIMPDGSVRGLLYDEQSGERFIRAARLYRVPVWDSIPLTWYARHGNVFAHGCALLTGVALAGVMVVYMLRKKQLHARVAGTNRPG